MNRVVMICAAACATLLAACSGTEVIVQAQLEGADGQPMALRQLPLELLPYDRDAIFDSLSAVYSEPEPQIPADLMSLRDSIARLREEWTTAEQRWGIVRDSLKQLSDRLRGMNPASGQYVVLYRDFNALAPQENSLKTRSEQAFNRFTSLDRRYATQADSLKLARDAWGDAAFADVNDVITTRLKNLRLEIHADTTNDNGIARITGLKKGQWWIHARYDLPFEELYWNLPLTVNGSPVQVQLTRATAKVRPKL